MQPVPRVIVDAFAAAFAGKGRSSGFSAQEISDYFCAQSALVRPLEHYGIKPATKRELFVECLYSLTPEAQYCALHQLAASEHPCRNADPARARAYERHRRRRRYQPAAGDRHGTAQGITLQDKHLAVLCVHACGTVGLCFIEKHLFAPMQPHEGPGQGQETQAET